MIDRNTIAPWTEREALDNAFVGITGDVHARHHYIGDCPTFEYAVEVQERVGTLEWENEADARKDLDRITEDLEKCAANDGIMDAPVTMGGPTLRLPIANVDTFENTIVTGARRISDDEFVPELMTGVTGKFSGFFYDLTEDGTQRIKARLVYQVLVGRAMTANVCALQFASADVSYLTTFDFAKDRHSRELMDALEVFKQAESPEVIQYVNHLLELTTSASAEYTAEDLNTIADIVQMLTTHDELKNLRQQTIESLEVIVIMCMTPRLGRHAHTIEHTAGLVHIAADENMTVPVPYKLDDSESPAVLDTVPVNQLVIMPTYNYDEPDVSSGDNGESDENNKMKPSVETAYEPYMIVEMNDGVCYVPLSKVTALK